MKDELIGIELVEEFIIKCADCCTSLAEVVVSETNDAREKRGEKAIHSQFKVVQCYDCGGSSFLTKVFDGSIFVGSLQDGCMIDTEDTEIDDNGVIVTTLIVRKKKV